MPFQERLGVRENSRFCRRKAQRLHKDTGAVEGLRRSEQVVTRSEHLQNPRQWRFEVITKLPHGFDP